MIYKAVSELNRNATAMTNRVIFVIFSCIALVFGLPGDRKDERIIGGQNAYLGQFPHQISMQGNNGHFCGGSIVNPTKILTAAHCIYGKNVGDFQIVAGIDNLSQLGQRVGVARGIYHINFNPTLLTNDVAVLILSAPLVYNQYVQPIALAVTNPVPGAVLTLSGWGFHDYPPTEPTYQLQAINLINLDLVRCAAALQGESKPITNGNICTTSQRGFGACQGDSGGPLISGNVQVGIVSWGIPCALGYPDVFTSVAAYRSFIDSYN